MHRNDGIVIRGARRGELDAVATLLAERGDPADATDLRLVAADADEGLASVLVAVDEGRVVSTATLLRETIVVGGVPLPAAQVEMVATDPSHEGRGLVRSLMDLAHTMSRDRGDVVQVMIGIPFFYRQFGYSYSMRIPFARELRSVPADDPSTIVRLATAADIVAMDALQQHEQRPVQVSMPHSPGCWRWLLARDGSAQWVAEREGVVVATGRATSPHEGVVLGELAGEARGIGALVAHAHRVATTAGGGPAVVMERPGTAVHDVLDPLLTTVERPDALGDWYYARIERLGPVLQALRPVLGRRWLEAGGGEHDMMISSFRSHVRFHLGTDGMGDVVEAGPLQAPVSAGGSGVPPDALPSMVLGPAGATGLEERHPDMMLGRQRELMAVLFPPVQADLLTFYLPV